MCADVLISVSELQYVRRCPYFRILLLSKESQMAFELLGVFKKMCLLSMWYLWDYILKNNISVSKRAWWNQTKEEYKNASTNGRNIQDYLF